MKPASDNPLSEETLQRIRREIGRMAPAGEVDDLAQETCARIIEKEALYRPERGAASGWATALARNVVRNRRRKERREREVRAELRQQQARDDDDPFAEDRIRHVLEQFSRLPEAERRLLGWRYLEGRPVTDIADELGISQPAATRRIQGALSLLRQRSRAGWLSAPLPAVLQMIGAHKMKIAAVAAVACLAAAGPSWFLPDPDTAVIATTAELDGSGFAPALSSKLDPKQNLLWCASSTLGWMEMKELLGGDVELSTEPPAADALNRSPFTRDDVDAASYVAGAGIVGDGIVPRLQTELQEKFGRGPDPRLTNLARTAGTGNLLAYCFLFKQIKWRWPFNELDPLPFKHDADGKPTEQRVKAWGLANYRKMYGMHMRIGRQVRVWERGDNGEEFVVALGHPEIKDRVVLAMIKPGETLQATVDDALQLASGKGGRLRNKDQLRIPVFDFSVLHDFPSIRGAVRNAKHAGKPIAACMQEIQFRLDHKGATMKSFFGMAGGKEMRPPPPRKLIFDKPFLLLMQEKGKRPYMVMWAAQPELMVSVK